jgi:hypothetical protein
VIGPGESFMADRVFSVVGSLEDLLGGVTTPQEMTSDLLGKIGLGPSEF